jgi:hypothetical protein
MRATYEVISHRPVVLPPADMASRIRQAIAQADAAPVVPVRMRFNPRPVYATAASLALLAAVVFAVNHASHIGGRHVEVAVNTHSTNSTTPLPSNEAHNAPVVKPHEPEREIASDQHATPAKPNTHAPMLVANAHEPERHSNRETEGEYKIELPRPHAVTVHPPHTNIARVTPSHSSMPHPVVRNTPSPERVARVSPEHVQPAPQPEHISTPAPQPEHVAVAPAPTPSPAPDRVATVAPEPRTVNVAVETHPMRGLNDDLRETVLTKWRPGGSSETRSFKVARVRAPHDDAINIVGTAIN